MGKFMGISGHVCGFKEKPCAVCSTVFKPKSGMNKFCSNACRGKWKYITGTGNTEAQYAKISGNWKRYFNRLCCRSHKRNGLSVENLLRILEKQNGKCALSGETLTCKLEKGIKFSTNASIDRIVAGGSYSEENVQLVCSALNSWRAATPIEEFIDWCKKVSDYAQQKGRS